MRDMEDFNRSTYHDARKQSDITEGIDLDELNEELEAMQVETSYAETSFMDPRDIEIERRLQALREDGNENIGINRTTGVINTENIPGFPKNLFKCRG